MHANGALSSWSAPSAGTVLLPTLGRVLEDLGSTFLSALAPVPDRERRVGGVIVYDPLDTQAVPDGAVVLGAGLTTGPELLSLLSEAGEKTVSAIVLREPVVLDEASVEAAREHGIAMLELTRGASWIQLSAMISAMLTGAEDGPGDAIGGLPTGDLFALANAIGGLLDAPITIEDRNSRVLAFSGRQEEADPSRIETVLERQVPERYARLLREAGFFTRLYSSAEPEYLDLTVDGEPLKTRCAIAVRAGEEILGSIWAVVAEPLSEERAAALRDAARVAALHLLRLRAGADVERRMRADLLGTALEGGERTAYALDRLGIGDSIVVVLAAETADPVAEAEDEGTRRARLHRVSDAIAVHLSAVHPRAHTALLDSTIYAVLPVLSEDGGERQALRVAEDFLTRVGPRLPIAIGIGRVGRGPRGIVRSRETAERVLRVAHERGQGTSSAVLFADAHMESLLRELRDRIAVSGEGPTGPVARLLAHDDAHGTAFAETLRVWLDCLGDVAAAASMLHIHTNTCRYRLRRLAELGPLDLADPDARFAAHLQLRLMS